MLDASVADPSCYWQDPDFDSDHHSFYYGFTLQVPMFIKTGDRVRMLTEDGSFLERA